MNLLECLDDEKAPKIALIRNKNWMPNKALLRYNRNLAIVNAWDSPLEDFTPNVEELLSGDWEIVGYCDKWFDAAKRHNINKKVEEAGIQEAEA